MDASVAAKWVVAEDHSDRAASLLDWGRLHAPAHWLAEAVNVLWGKVYRGDLSAQDADERACVLAEAPVLSVPLAPLLRDSLALSVSFGITVHDSLHLALAQQRNLPFVTADLRLVRKIGLGGLKSGSIMWVGDIA